MTTDFPNLALPNNLCKHVVYLLRFLALKFIRI